MDIILARMTKSIKKTLEKIIQDNDFLEDGLYNGYINITALAIYLLPTISKLCGKESTVGSISMTLSRIVSTIQRSKKIRLRPDDMRVRTGITYVTFQKVPWLSTMLNDTSKQFNYLDSSGNNLYSELEWSREITVLYTTYFATSMSHVIQMFPPKKIIEDLVSIIFHIPPDFIEEKWVLYHIVKQLNYFWVNIIELYTTLSEVTIIIRKENLNAAMSVLV